MLDVADGLVEELGDVVVVEAVDDAAAVTPPGDQAQGRSRRNWCETADCSMPTAAANSLTGYGDCRRVSRISSREGVDRAWSVAATEAAVVSSSRAAATTSRPPRSMSSACTGAGLARRADELQRQRGRRLGEAGAAFCGPAHKVVSAVVVQGEADPDGAPPDCSTCPQAPQTARELADVTVPELADLVCRLAGTCPTRQWGAGRTVPPG